MWDITPSGCCNPIGCDCPRAASCENETLLVRWERYWWIRAARRWKTPNGQNGEHVLYRDFASSWFLLARSWLPTEMSSHFVVGTWGGWNQLEGLCPDSVANLKFSGVPYTFRRWEAFERAPIEITDLGKLYIQYLFPLSPPLRHLEKTWKTFLGNRVRT